MAEAMVGHAANDYGQHVGEVTTWHGADQNLRTMRKSEMEAGMTPSPQQQWDARITEILDLIAETYCQLGESGKERTTPMKAGSAYLELINKAVAEIVIDTPEPFIPEDYDQGIYWEDAVRKLKDEQRAIIGGDK